jgi:16S rRNA (cytosine967-C5)-methyltransferase
VVVADGTRPAWRADRFDRVVADVPCSGLGSLRRRPELRWRRQPADVASLVPLQRDLLDSAIDAARPGGIVAYATCSPHPDETVGVVEAVVARRPDLTRLDAREALPDVPDVGPGPYVQLWPHKHGTDAMFIALIRRA